MPCRSIGEIPEESLKVPFLRDVAFSDGKLRVCGTDDIKNVHGHSFSSVPKNELLVPLTVALALTACSHLL